MSRSTKRTLRSGCGGKSSACSRPPLQHAPQNSYRETTSTMASISLERSAATSKHLFSPVQSAGSARLFTWSMRQQEYTIAFAGAKDPQGACLLCHVN